MRQGWTGDQDQRPVSCLWHWKCTGSVLGVGIPGWTLKWASSGYGTVAVDESCGCGGFDSLLQTKPNQTCLTRPLLAKAPPHRAAQTWWYRGQSLHLHSGKFDRGWQSGTQGSQKRSGVEWFKRLAWNLAVGFILLYRVYQKAKSRTLLRGKMLCQASR